MPNYFKNGSNPEERRRVLPGYPKDLIFKNLNCIITSNLKSNLLKKSNQNFTQCRN